MALNSMLMKAAWIVQKQPWVALGFLAGAAMLIYEKGRYDRPPSASDIDTLVLHDPESCPSSEKPLLLIFGNGSDQDLHEIDFLLFGEKRNGERATQELTGVISKDLVPEEKHGVCWSAPREKLFNGVDFDEIAWRLRIESVK